MAETRIWVEIRQSGTNDNRVTVPVSSNGAADAERWANGNGRVASLRRVYPAHWLVCG